MGKAEKLSELKASNYNPRTISDRAFEGLKYSLEEFGDLSGITFNTRTGNLVSGHQRVRALTEQYGDLQVSEGKIQTPGGESFQVRYVDWDEVKEKAANLAANNPYIQGEFTNQVEFLLDEISLSLPEAAESLLLYDITADLSASAETIQVPTETSDMARETRNLVKFGSKTIYLSDDEMSGLLRVYNEYCDRMKNSHGFISYLIEGK